MNNAILILEPESSGTGLLGAAERLGFAVCVFDRRAPHELPGPVAAAVRSGRAEYTRVDMRDPDAVVDAAVSLAARVPLAAVVSGFEYAVETTALVAAKLGLIGIDPVAAGALRDKLRMKRMLGPLAAGPAVPIAYGDDGTEAAAALTFPAVVKPVDGSGSLMVRRVDSAAELREHVAALRRGLIDDMGKSFGGALLAEPYVEGPEFSVEGFVARGRVCVAAVTGKRLGREPHFAEIGHVVEAGFDPARRAVLARTAQQAVEALRITVGAFHLEARLSARGPSVIEVAARLGGDRIPDLVAQVHGRDLYEAVILASAGLPVPEPQAAPTARVAAVRMLTVEQEARLGDPGLLRAELARIPGCGQVVLDAAAGQTLLPATDFRQRFGHVLLTAADRGGIDIALAAVDRALASAVEAIPCVS